MASREEFIKKLRETFKIEAAEGIANMTSNLMELEKEQTETRKAELVEATFREAHSLKGAARAVNISEIESICQAMESVFSLLKNKTLSLAPGLFDLFHLAVDLLNDLLAKPEGEITESLIARISDLNLNLAEAESGNFVKVERLVTVQKEFISEEKKVIPGIIETPAPKAEPIVEPTVEIRQAVSRTDNTIRISVEKLDSLLNQAEELLSLKQTFGNFSNKLYSLTSKLNLLAHESTLILPLVRDFQNEQDRFAKEGLLLCNEKEMKAIVQFFEWANSMVKNLKDDLAGISKLNQEEEYNSGVKIESLLDDVKKIISVPFSGILEVFPKSARDLSKDKGKLVNLEIIGGEIEIDRRILEELRNPLMHLLRNTIDHGIEVPEVRKLKNKPDAGKIQVKIEHAENNQIEITFSDDGAGVDLEKVRKKYRKQEKIQETTSTDIDDQTLLDYLFKSGISTSEMITDLSGRGLGLAIVKEKIEQIGGSVTLKTQKNKGSEFKITVPLSLVTFRGVHLQVSGHQFVVPTSKIVKVLRLNKSELKTIENKPTIPWQDGIIPLVYLSDILEIPYKNSESNFIMVIILGSQENQLGFVVDEILDEDIILVKKFNSQLKRVRNIAGATVTGSGKVVPILNVADLLKSSVRNNSTRQRENANPLETVKKSILVVEDSITSRMLLKNILETAGYVVSTAIDGIEGYSKTKSEPFNLIVSDIDMPRMSGLDMTAKIRSDKSIAEIPIVLVTSLSKREDRERGMEVGANAYIVKSNFDQSNLLEVVERLIG